MVSILIYWNEFQIFISIHLVYNICVITLQFQLSLSSTNETYLYQRKHLTLCAVSNITVPYGSLYYLDGDYKESKHQGLSGFINKAFLRHCSAKHCLRHGSGGGIYFLLTLMPLTCYFLFRSKGSELTGCVSINNFQFF